MSQKRKKPSFNSGMNEIESSQNKTDRKKSQLSKDTLYKYQNIKERIATEPVDGF
jgi:hypothetical protein